MGLTGTRTYVGFGFGPIQAGLFAYEAFVSGNFGRLVVAEVLPEVVAAVRKSDGYFSVNIAHPNRVEHARLGPIEIEDPSQESDRKILVDAIAEATEIGTAIPSVTNYVSEGPASLHRILAEGLKKKATQSGPRAVVYAAENHNHAAEKLEVAVLGGLPASMKTAIRTRVQFLNTVIGKMSGVKSDVRLIREHGLTTMVPGDDRAFLVEVFNKILISRIELSDDEGDLPFRRGIKVFEEKEDLRPFEEAKLYGHNATHALAAYVGALLGARRIAELDSIPGALEFLRAAFIQESGETLIRKHAGVDPLFTPDGYEYYADDLLDRMISPFLLDTVERVGRDPSRKLGWNDRLVGTIREALKQGVEPRRYAFGAAAALAMLDPSSLDQDFPARETLEPIWSESSTTDGEKSAVLDRIEAGLERIRTWLHTGSNDPKRLLDGAQSV